MITQSNKRKEMGDDPIPVDFRGGLFRKAWAVCAAIDFSLLGEKAILLRMPKSAGSYSTKESRTFSSVKDVQFRPLGIIRAWGHTSIIHG